MSLSNNVNEAVAPFWHSEHNNNVADAFAEKNQSDFSGEVNVCAVTFSKNEIAGNCDQNIKEGIDNSFDADFAAVFASGKNNENWSHENDK